MLEALALFLVALSGLYFCVLALAALLFPARAKRFLLGFAGSPQAHYSELAIRLLVGWAFITCAPRLPSSAVFHVFGWLLLATSACLFLFPWQWHHRFAKQAVPQAIRYIMLIGICSLALGCFILMAVIRGSTD